MLIGSDISLAFGMRDLFKEISFNFDRESKIGCVGRNGAGKSTMLKVIAGLIQPDEGSISIERGRRVAYLPQEVVLASSRSVLDEAYSAFEEMMSLQLELADIERQLENKPELVHESVLERYAYLQDKLSTYDPVDALVKTKKILKGLGFDEDRLLKTVDTLSVGWKMRLVLAKQLLSEADFYLFDEPTNHLDIVAQQWFIDFLRNAPFGYMLVSHDRFFLDNACAQVFEIDRGNGTIYNGNYSSYLQQKEQASQAREQAYLEQQRDIKRQKETISRFKAKASKAGMAQSMQKKLDKLEIVEPEPKPPSIRLNFGHLQQAGRVVLQVKDVAQSFNGVPLFAGVNCEIPRGEKVALVAANGVGKTTLLSLIAGRYPLQQGSVEFGYNVTWALFEQDQDKVLTPERTVLDEVLDSCRTSGAREKARAFLGAFLFTKDDVNKKIHMLSGGEKNRVAMVKVLLTEANFLILDEPTNHLDLDAKEIMLKALSQFSGTILFVSHDRTFLDKLATMTLELTPQGLYSYAGNYTDYLYHKQAVGLADAAPAHVTPVKKQEETKKVEATKSSLSGRELFEARKKAQSMERKIGKLEQQLVELTSSGDADVRKIQECQKEVATLTAEWEALLQKIGSN